MRVVVAEWMADAALAELRAAARVSYDPDLWRDPDHLTVALFGAQGLVVRNQCRVGAPLLAAAPDLKVIGRLGSGLDNIDLAAMRAAGIPVVHARGANAVATGEFTLLLALALTRQLPAAVAAATQGHWRRSALVGTDLAGARLGVVGLGHVGTVVARRARALGMEVLASHPARHPDDPEVRDCGARLVAPEVLLRTADVVSLHLPLRPATSHWLGRRRLALMRPDAVLINTARGALVDEAALGEALADGWIAGAALDVREQEPPPAPDPLAALPNVILTPHIAGLSAQAQRTACLRVVEGVLAVLGGRRPVNSL